MLTWIKALDRVLKGEATRPTSLRGGRIDLPVGGLSFVVLLLGVVYGLCMGSFALIARWHTPGPSVADWWNPGRIEGLKQMAYSAAKVPMLFFLTLVVTFPSLYVFNALVGSRLSFSAVLRLLVAALGVTLAVLASFGTIIVFFSLCTTSYAFMVLLNVTAFAVAGLLGMGFLLQTLHRLSIAQAVQDAEASRAQAMQAAQSLADAQAADPASLAPDGTALPPPPVPPPIPGALERLEGHTFGPRVKMVFRVWVLVFGLVGAQMGWVLRPFIGDPNQPVSFFRDRQGSFFEAVFHKIEDLATGSEPRGRHRGWRGTSSDIEPGYGGRASPGQPPARPATNPASP
jgi:hypothetical protein